jgi:hypothetical protein
MNKSRISPADAAKMLMEAYGQNDQLSLADIERASGCEIGSKNGQIIAGQWSMMTGGRPGPMSLSDLTKAVQLYSDVQNANDARPWGYKANGQVGQLSDSDIAPVSAQSTPGDVTAENFRRFASEGQFVR